MYAKHLWLSELEHITEEAGAELVLLRWGRKDPRAEFISKIDARDLMQRNLDDLVIERPCLEIIEAYPAASCRVSSQ